MSTTGRIALVTGAGTGIGKRTALLLLEAGYSVVLAGRRVEPLEQTVREKTGIPFNLDIKLPGSLYGTYIPESFKEKWNKVDRELLKEFGVDEDYETWESSEKIYWNNSGCAWE